MASTFTTGEILAKLKALREGLALRQEIMAARLGVDRSTYVRKELGTIPITTDEWLKIAKALDREPCFFFRSSSKPVLVEKDLRPRERALLKLYRSLRTKEQDEMVCAVYMRLRGIRRKAVQDAVRRLREA